jgi:hypothetical protein
MKALGTLAAGIAHISNNILSIFKGSAQIIEDNLDQPQKVLGRPRGPHQKPSWTRAQVSCAPCWASVRIGRDPESYPLNAGWMTP